MPMFIVKYVDDFKRIHLTVARNLEELRFLQDRFETVAYEAVEK